MELIGAIKRKFPIEAGVSARGPWTKQCLLIETQGQYPKQVYCEDFGDKANLSRFEEGDMVRAQIELSSREHNGRYYTGVSVWRIELHGDTVAAAPEAQPVAEPAPTLPAQRRPTGQPAPPIPAVKAAADAIPFSTDEFGDNDLPF